jgi:hypothetical protein
MPLEFVGAPIPPEVSSAEAESLAAGFVDATVTLTSDTDLSLMSVTREGGSVSMQVLGPAGVWQLQRSEDLTNWVPVLTFTNATGIRQCVDPGATNVAQRFYRAVKQ